jgi:hypothetical protein
MSVDELQRAITTAGTTALEYLVTVVNSNFAVAFIGALAGAYAGGVAAHRSIVKTQEKNELLTEMRSVNAAIIVSLSICNTLLGLKSQIVKPLFDRFSADRSGFKAALEQLRSGQRPDAPIHCQMDFTAFTVPLLPIDALKDLIYRRISAHGKPLNLVSQIEGAEAGLRAAVARRELIADEFKRKPPPKEQLPFFYYGERLDSGQTYGEYADVLEVIRSYTNDAIWFSAHLCDELVKYGRAREKQFDKRFGNGSPKINEPDFKQPRETGLIPPDAEYSSWLQWIVERKLDAPDA